jgi:hypothetical protein
VRRSIKLDYLEPKTSFIFGLIGSMPLQLSQVRKMPLQKLKLEICHYNSLIPLHMPLSSLKRIKDQNILVFKYVFEY